MQRSDPTVTAWRFVYGKLVRESGGTASPGFEHRVTSISQGLPAGLLPLCRPQEVLGHQSVQALTHPQRERDGALFFRPACCDGRRYMLATCVRARPESGEGGLSRTHTQLATFVFRAVDWNSYAPRLLANAGRWLRAEPDTVAFHEQYRDHGDCPPVVLGPAQLAAIPSGAAGPLPKVGSLLWRLIGALEKADERLVCGAADRIDSVDTFLRALACATALLPEPLRIYLSAAAGFAEVQDAPRFALQYLPEAAALPPAAPGLLEQLAGQLVGADPAADQEDWQRSWRPETADRERWQFLQDLAAPAGWQSAAAARTRFTQVADDLIARRSLRELAAWLDGTRAESPARPTLRHPRLGTDWVLELTRRGSAGRSAVGCARALVRIATLIDTDGGPPARLDDQARYWAQAWRAAAASPSVDPRSVLCWSALCASRLADDPADAVRREIGYLKDFRELRMIAEAMQRARAESPADAALIHRTLGNAAFNRRLDELRRRADDILIRRPLGIIDLAASFPALLAPRPGDDAQRVGNPAETIRALLIAARLYAWTDEDLPEGQQDLAAAVRRVAERSLQIRRSDDDLRCDCAQHAQDYGKSLLRRYWQWALAPDAERDHECTLWRDAVVLAFYLQVRENGLTGPIRLLFDTCRQGIGEAADTRPDWTRLECAAAALFDLCLAGVDDLYEGPAKMALDLLRVLSDLPQPAPRPDGQCITGQLAAALDRGLCRALRDQRVGPREWLADFLPVFSAVIGDWLADSRNNATEHLIRRLPTLASLLLERLLQSGGPLPRSPLTELFDRLEWLVSCTPMHTADLADHMDSLASALARCILGWAEADPPEPWQDWRVPLVQAPVRRTLAQRLGFPRCVYFAALAPANDHGPQVRDIQAATPKAPRPPAVAALGLPPQAAGSVGKVIAYGAATTWRGLFDQGAAEELQRLLQDPATDEAIVALAALAQSGNRAYRPLIDDETWFTIAFFGSLGQDRSPLGQWPVPASLHAALLSDGSRHHGCYALQLGRQIATGPSRIGGHLQALFDAGDSNALVAGRVLLLSNQGWADFLHIKQPRRRHALLRLLFLLGLIVELNNFPTAARGRLTLTRASIFRALQLAPEVAAVKGAMDGFFSRDQDIAAAFQQAVDLANIPRPPGWPIRGRVID